MITRIIFRCKPVAAWLTLYACNALEPERAAHVAAHLAACPACRHKVAALRQLANLLRDHKPAAVAPAPDLWGRIQAEIAVPDAPPWRRRPGLAQAAGFAAAACAIFSVLALRPAAPPIVAVVPHPTAKAAAPLVASASQAPAPVVALPPSHPAPAPAPAFDPFEPFEERSHAVPAKSTTLHARRRARPERPAGLALRRAPTPRPATPPVAAHPPLPIPRAQAPEESGNIMVADAGDAGEPNQFSLRTNEDATTTDAAVASADTTLAAAGVGEAGEVPATLSAIEASLSAKRQNALFQYARP